MNLTQIARGNFSSLSRWSEKAYAYNPQDGKGEQWVSGSPHSAATLSVSASRLVFGPTLKTVVTQRGLTYSTSIGQRYLRLRCIRRKGVVTAMLVNQDVAINWTVTFYPNGPGRSLQTDNGGRLAPRPTVVLWTSNDGFTQVFQP